jgi:hypothetical protein
MVKNKFLPILITFYFSIVIFYIILYFHLNPNVLMTFQVFCFLQMKNLEVKYLTRIHLLV